MLWLGRGSGGGGGKAAQGSQVLQGSKLKPCGAGNAKRGGAEKFMGAA